MGTEYFCELIRAAAILEKPVSWVEYRVEKQLLGCKSYRGERYIPVNEVERLLKSLLTAENPGLLANPNWCADLNKSSPSVVLLESLNTKSISITKGKTSRKKLKKNAKIGVKRSKSKSKIKFSPVQSVIKIPRTVRETPEEAKQRQARNAKTYEHFRSTWCEQTNKPSSGPVRKMDHRRYYDQEE